MLLMAPNMKIAKFCEATGYTDKAVRRKIQDGVWLEGYEYHRAETGEITIDVWGYNRWTAKLPRRKMEEPAAA